MSASVIAPHPFDQPAVLDADEMHRLKNTPISVPDWLVAKLNDAARTYRHQDFPAAIYGTWTDDRKRVELITLASRRGLDLTTPQGYAAAERLLPPYDSRLVQDEGERQRYYAQGWAETPDGVKAAENAYQERIAYQAAMRAKDDLTLGEKAKAELEAAEDAAEDHVLDVQPVKRGRPKAVTAAS